MPIVGNQNKLKSLGKNHYHTKEDVIKMAQPEFARDDIRQAFAGEENKGPSGTKSSQKHSTNVKSRKTEKSKGRTPIR